MSLTRKNKTIVALIISVIAVLFGVYSYVYQPPKTTEDFTVSFEGNATEFIELLETDYTIWNTKAVQLTGTITSVVDNNFVLNNSIFCQLREGVTLPETNEQQITIRGIVIGYDELLNELKLNQCILKNP